MSVQAIVAVLHRSETTLGTRLVMLAVANYYGDDGAWPSVDTLARDCRMSTRQVQRCLKTAELAGELKIEPRAGRNGTNLYRLLLEGVTNRQGDNPGPEMSPEPKEPKATTTTGAPRKRDTTFDALAAEEGHDGDLPRKAARAIGVALAEIREVAPAVDAAEIHTRAAAYRRLWPGVAFTANGLAKYWARCGSSLAAVPSLEDVEAARRRRIAEDDAAIAALLERESMTERRAD